ncbi:hypothetical protein KEM48_008414 [Puccinia striiformis f. sp. tritici PST-130]|nr:hypothetical protein KEM48_008414 [Puccinia striiformis f. sp. tritici PST-130]
MTHLANHSLDREILYSTLGGLQPGGMCLAWVSGATICEALRLMQRFDPKTTWDKRVFVYFSFFMSVSLLSLFQARIYQDVIVHYGDYQKLLEVTDILRFNHVATRIRSSLIFIIYVLPWKLIEGAVLSLMKAYDLVKSGEAQKVLADTDDPLGLCWSVLCCLCQTAILPTVFDLIALSLPTSLGVNGAAHSMRSISAQLHLFGPSVAISAALDDMTFPSVELCCSPKNSVSEEMYETSKNILTFRKEKKVSFKLPEMGQRENST